MLTDAKARSLASEWHGGRWSGLYCISCKVRIADVPTEALVRALAEVGEDYEQERVDGRRSKELTDLGEYIRFQLAERRRYL